MNQNLATSRLLAVALAIILICPLLAAGYGAFHFLGPAVAPPPEPIHWFIFPDVSASVKPAWFEAYKTRIVTETVLCRLREGDEVAITPLSNDTDDGETRSFIVTGGGLLGPDLIIAQIRDYIKTLTMRTNQSGTDFAGAVSGVLAANVKRICDRDPRAKCVAVFRSDGEADGKQHLNKAVVPPGVDLYIWGTKRRDIQPTLAAILKSAQIDVANVRQIAFGDSDSAARTFGNPYHRPPNDSLAKLLLSGAPIDADHIMQAGLQ